MGVDRHEKTTNILLLLFATGSFLQKKIPLRQKIKTNFSTHLMAHRLDSIHRFHFVVVNHQTVVHERTNGDAQERRGWCRGWAGTAGETATTTCDIPGRLDACGCSFSSPYFHRPFSHFPPFLIIYYFVPFLYYIDFVSNIGGQVKKKKSSK